MSEKHPSAEQPIETQVPDYLRGREHYIDMDQEAFKEAIYNDDQLAEKYEWRHAVEKSYDEARAKIEEADAQAQAEREAADAKAKIRDSEMEALQSNLETLSNNKEENVNPHYYDSSRAESYDKAPTEVLAEKFQYFSSHGEFAKDDANELQAELIKRVMRNKELTSIKVLTSEMALADVAGNTAYGDILAHKLKRELERTAESDQTPRVAKLREQAVQKLQIKTESEQVANTDEPQTSESEVPQLENIQAPAKRNYSDARGINWEDLAAKKAVEPNAVPEPTKTVISPTPRNYGGERGEYWQPAASNTEAAEPVKADPTVVEAPKAPETRVIRAEASSVSEHAKTKSKAYMALVPEVSSDPKDDSEEVPTGTPEAGESEISAKKVVYEGIKDGEYTPAIEHTADSGEIDLEALVQDDAVIYTTNGEFYFVNNKAKGIVELNANDQEIASKLVRLSGDELRMSFPEGNDMPKPSWDKGWEFPVQVGNQAALIDLGTVTRIIASDTNPDIVDGKLDRSDYEPRDGNPLLAGHNLYAPAGESSVEEEIARNANPDKFDEHSTRALIEAMLNSESEEDLSAARQQPIDATDTLDAVKGKDGTGKPKAPEKDGSTRSTRARNLGKSAMAAMRDTKISNVFNTLNTKKPEEAMLKVRDRVLGRTVATEQTEQEADASSQSSQARYRDRLKSRLQKID